MRQQNPKAMSNLTFDKQFNVIRCSESVKTLNLRKINLRVIGGSVRTSHRNVSFPGRPTCRETAIGYLKSTRDTQVRWEGKMQRRVLKLVVNIQSKMFYRVNNNIMIKFKGIVHSRTGHAGPQRE